MKKFFKLQKIDAELKVFTIEWHIGTHCNFFCSYCDVYNNTKNPFPENFKNMLKFLNVLRYTYKDKNIIINILGGEPTMWKDLSDFVEECLELKIAVYIITNGSKDIEWFKNDKNTIATLDISYHPEFSKKEHIIKILDIIKYKKKNMFIVFMMTLEHFYENYKLAKELTKRYNNLNVKLAPIRINNKLLDYTIKQKNIMKNPPRNINYIEYKNKYDFYNIEITSKILLTYIDGVRTDSRHNILLNKQTNFEGWTCTAGIECIRVTKEGEIIRCLGYCGPSIGNINSAYKLPKEPIICTRKTSCVSAHEISATKWSPQYNLLVPKKLNKGK